MGSITRSGRFPGGRHGKPFQYSCLENPMERGPWQATVHRLIKSQIWLKWLSMHTCQTWSCGDKISRSKSVLTLRGTERRSPCPPDLRYPLPHPLAFQPTQCTSCLLWVRMDGWMDGWIDGWMDRLSRSCPPRSLPPPAWSYSITLPEWILKSHPDQLDWSLHFNLVGMYM